VVGSSRVPTEEIRPVYAAGACEIDLARRELRVLDSPVPIGGRAFEILEVLARSAGKLVTKDELARRIWPGAIVAENRLQVHAMAIRKALGPYRNLLKTESGRGYRLLGDWTVRRHDAAKPPVALQRMPAGESPVTNFPATITHLVGRSVAVAQLRDLISAYRMVSLTGPGGIGKTALALKVTRGVVGEYIDGAWLVELAPLSDPALVPAAVASVLRLGGGPHGVTLDAITRTIGDRKLLLVLDNCEHLIAAVASLAESLITFCPHITIVATSREALRIEGEHVWRVPPLEVPASGQRDAAGILRHSAVELFIARARESGAEIGSDTSHVQAIAAMCRHLDGIPLAIELAGARTASLGLEQVASGLRDRFAMLTNGRRTALPKHRTLRATLDWSYQLLNEAERDLLRRLAIFAGPFSLDAAYAVAAEGTGLAEVANGVAGLVSKSLVLRTTDPAAVEFRLFETTRVYAMDRLVESGALAGVARRHATYFLNVLGHLEDERRSKPPDEYLAAFRRRADEVHGALEWAFSSTGDTTIGLALTLAAEPLWFELFQLVAALGRVEQALSHADVGSDVEMRLRIALGRVLWYSAPESNAIEPASVRALEIAERTGATDVQIQALWGIWAARRGRGDYPAALEAAHRYAEAAANARNVGAIHLGDRILGWTHHFMGHQAIAREFAERALGQAHHFDPTSGIGFQVETPAAMACLLARILWLTGFPDQAKVAAKEAVVAAAKSGHSYSVCYAISVGGLPVALWTGDIGEAQRLFELLVAHAGGMPRMELRVSAFARLLKLRDGDEDEALVASFIESHGDTALIPPFADLDRDAEIAVPLPREEPIDATWNTPETLRVDAELLLWHAVPGAVAAAEAKLLRALEIAREQSALSWELRAAMSLAQLWGHHRRATEARDLLAGTYRKFAEGFGTSDLIRARNMMTEPELDSSTV
jgi:predicted ATPase/DNA-binding winged helix-turn-helix (wHTH) protein